MDIQAVLFDLDGTLADTAADLGGALNDLLRARGYPEKPLADIRPHASHGSGALVSFGTGMAQDDPAFAEWRQAYLHCYEQRFTQDTRLFDGINPLLAELARHGMAWGIISNKPERFTLPLAAALDWAAAPAVVVGGDTCAEAKPSVLPMLHACRQINVPPERCVYVGDAERDIQAGNAAGMHTVLAAWGYIGADDQPERWGADFIAAHPADILQMILK